MKSIYEFIVEPIGDRYNNKKKIGDSELILNTEIFNHQYINRLAKIISTPIIGDTLGLSKGDEVIIHHNVFRRWHDVRGIERNSSNYFNESKYIVSQDLIYAVKKENTWAPLNGYHFVQPLKNNSIFSCEKEKLVGMVVYSDNKYKKGDIVGFTPKGSKFEFIIDGQRVYRIKSNKITVKYECQGNEETYNPSWAESS